MIFLLLTVAWLLGVAASIAFFLLIVVLAGRFLALFPRGGSGLAWGLKLAGDAITRPFRRLLRPLRLNFDASPWLAAAAFFLVMWACRRGMALLVGPGLVVNPRVEPLITTLRIPLYAYLLMVLLRVLVSWFGSPEYHPMVRFLARWVDPVLDWIRRVLRPRLGPADLSPLVLFAAIGFIDQVVLNGLLLTL